MYYVAQSDISIEIVSCTYILVFTAVFLLSVKSYHNQSSGWNRFIIDYLSTHVLVGAVGYFIIITGNSIWGIKVLRHVYFHLGLLGLILSASYRSTTLAHNISSLLITVRSKITPLEGFALVLICMLALLSPPDADSLYYHQPVANYIAVNYDFPTHDYGYLHAQLAGAGEVLSAVGVLSGTKNLVLWLNVLSLALLTFYFALFNTTLYCRLLILSVPALISLAVSNKPYLFIVVYVILSISWAAKNRLSNSDAPSQEPFLPSIFLVSTAVLYKLSFIPMVVLYLYISNKSLRSHDVTSIDATKNFIYSLLLVTAVLIILRITFSYHYYGISSVETLSLANTRNTGMTDLFNFIRQYRDSILPFPLPLFIPDGAGSLSTSGGLIFIFLLFLFRGIAPTYSLALFLGIATTWFFIQPTIRLIVPYALVAILLCQPKLVNLVMRKSPLFILLTKIQFWSVALVTSLCILLFTFKSDPSFDNLNKLDTMLKSLAEESVLYTNDPMILNYVPRRVRVEEHYALKSSGSYKRMYREQAVTDGKPIFFLRSAPTRTKSFGNNSKLLGCTQITLGVRNPLVDDIIKEVCLIEIIKLTPAVYDELTK